MALIDRPKRKPKPARTAGEGTPFATIDGDRFDEAGKNPRRKQLMEAADRYGAEAKQRSLD